jgi:hypothetical protein
MFNNHLLHAKLMIFFKSRVRTRGKLKIYEE